MGFYVKWLATKKYTECGFNKDGNLYVIYKVKVQRGMGHEKADEVLIIGMNRNRIDNFLLKENAVIVYRDDPPADEDILKLTSDEIKGKNKG